MPLTFLWVASGAAIAFLFACTAHNRRTGYRKTRVQESAIGDALSLLSAFRAYLSQEATAESSVSEVPLPSKTAVSAEAPLTEQQMREPQMAEPLLSLSSAVRGNQPVTPAPPASPRPLSASPAEATEEAILKEGPHAIPMSQ